MTFEMKQVTSPAPEKTLRPACFACRRILGGDMKKSVLSLIAVSSLLASSFVALANPAVDGRITADIPFDFTVGKAKLSAGQYSIQRGTSRSSLKLTCNKSSVMVLTYSGTT